MGPLIRLIRRAPVACFFAIAILFTWSLLPLASASIPISLVALFGPAVGAVVVAGGIGREELRALGRRTADWRIPVRWYLLALALPFPITALRSTVEHLAGARGGAIQLQPISAVGLVIFVLVAGEEAGWRGFALPRLLPRYGPWAASGIVGAGWALWHLPLFYLPAMPQYGSPFPAFVVYTISLSVLLTALALPTRSSVVIATLFHGAVNTFGLVNPAATPAMRGWANAASYGAAALIVGAVAWGRRGRAPLPSAAPANE